METLSQTAVLLIIDVQKGFDFPQWGKRNNPQAESKISALLNIWRQTSRPVTHVRHMSVEPNSPLRPGQSGNEFKEAVSPIDGERIEEKKVNSAFIGTGLEQYLRQNCYDTIVITGLTTDHCVSTSTRMAGNLGFRTYVVADATATFDRCGYDGRHYPAENVHAHALASLHEEFATVVKTKDILQAYQLTIL
jgi:nicotinamidase-related amidase